MGDAKESYTLGASGWDIYHTRIGIAEEVYFLEGRVFRVHSRHFLQEETFRQLAEAVEVETWMLCINWVFESREAGAAKTRSPSSTSTPLQLAKVLKNRGSCWRVQPSRIMDVRL